MSHAYIPMIRPDWNRMLVSVKGGRLKCSCGKPLKTIPEAKKHWRMGHFDYVDRDALRELKQHGMDRKD